MAEPRALDHTRLLLRAVELAHEHMVEGSGGPFGAVIAREGVILAEGWNQVTSTLDPTAHAEIVAIRKACRTLSAFSLAGSVLYSNCEPCPMCLSAIYWARLDSVYCALSRSDAAQIGFDDEHIYEELAKPPGERDLPVTRLDVPEAGAAFRAWLEKDDRIPY